MSLDRLTTSPAYRSTTINFMDVMVYEVSRHFWKLAISAGSVLVFCYASLMPVSPVANSLL